MVEAASGALPPQTHTLPFKERVEQGRTLRQRTARKHHAAWTPPDNRRDPVDILVEQGKSRLKDLLPLRYGRMKPTPFTFLRGAAAVMAADLATTPNSSLKVQACGDCHCANFGGFATPERRLVFDINDFDETAVAPWEWDVKRLATSFVVAALATPLSKEDRVELAQIVARRYRETMAEVAGQPVLEAWYHGFDLDEEGAARKVGVAARTMRKADATRIHPLGLEALDHTGGADPRIEDDRKGGVYHPETKDAAKFDSHAKGALKDYAQTLTPARRVLLERYRLADSAYKVVGVGSVGTRCGILLMVSGDGETFYLQFKEAVHSVLEPYAGASPYATCGERVVRGQRLLQGASDILLGFGNWGAKRHVYLRQLRDAKIKPDVDTMSPRNLQRYAGSCGEVLARAHARSGDAVVLSAYLGKSAAFDEAIGDFATSYARQTEQDHEALVKAIKKGRLSCRTTV
ncbi:MAG: DUF2252 domain-containing protein [Alphaproteobacteria bacterium]|nr:DUF2252 domain-containing protein [Alphaproteobacteria bacterium]MBV8406573.1 DUF2252 domain-containing protein [Alphaproteobacteria bacterium]